MCKGLGVGAQKTLIGQTHSNTINLEGDETHILIWNLGQIILFKLLNERLERLLSHTAHLKDCINCNLEA